MIGGIVLHDLKQVGFGFVVYAHFVKEFGVLDARADVGFLRFDVRSLFAIGGGGTGLVSSAASRRRPPGELFQEFRNSPRKVSAFCAGADWSEANNRTIAGTAHTPAAMAQPAEARHASPDKRVRRSTRCPKLERKPPRIPTQPQPRAAVISLAKVTRHLASAPGPSGHQDCGVIGGQFRRAVQRAPRPPYQRVPPQSRAGQIRQQEPQRVQRRQMGQFMRQNRVLFRRTEPGQKPRGQTDAGPENTKGHRTH